MISRIAALVGAFAIGPVALATNVIQEWGGHSVEDYQIDIDLETGDHLGVRILANTESTLPWKFEAYDDETQEPGHIDYIYIDPGVTVGNIKLSVIGQGAHEYGAQDLDLLNLVQYGSPSNVLEVIDIAGDCGADGEIQAYGAGSITIGGDLGPYGIHILGHSWSGDIEVIQDLDALITVDGDVEYDGSIVIHNTSEHGGLISAGT